MAIFNSYVSLPEGKSLFLSEEMEFRMVRVRSSWFFIFVGTETQFLRVFSYGIFFYAFSCFVIFYQVFWCCLMLGDIIHD